jgi:hypothetical protein
MYTVRPSCCVLSFPWLGLNNEQSIHTLPLQSPQLLSLRLESVPLETLRLVSLVSLITKT